MLWVRIRVVAFGGAGDFGKEGRHAGCPQGPENWDRVAGGFVEVHGVEETALRYDQITG